MLLVGESLYFPLFVDLSEKRVLVLGAGKIARRRVESLLDFAGQIIVVAPEFHPELTALAVSGQIEARRRAFLLADLDGADLVLAATDQPQLNAEICLLCQARGIPANSSSDRSLCDFYFPGLVRKDNLVLGISASGTDHAKVKAVCEKLRRQLKDLD